MDTTFKTRWTQFWLRLASLRYGIERGRLTLARALASAASAVALNVGERPRQPNCTCHEGKAGAL